MRSRLFPIFLFLALIPALALGQAPASSAQTAPRDPGQAVSAPPASDSAKAAPATSSSAKPAAADAKATPATPTTTMLAPSSPDKGAGSGGADPYLDVPPMPQGKTTLIGGMVRSIDQIRNRMTVEPFGGQRMSLRFDERTHVYRDGVETTQLGIRKGDRVYVDTMLDKGFVFARNVHVLTEAQPADARGQLLSAPTRTGVIVVQDELSSQPVRFLVDNTTVIKRHGQPGSQADLRPGALVAVRFAPERVNRGVAREVSVLALPGASFAFAGEITHLNLATGMLALRNSSDNKTYEIRFDPVATGARGGLAVGTQVNISAIFTGRGYEARQISVTRASTEQ